MNKRGKVFLIGAGPGDPELLTIKAVKALGAADVILIDALVNPAVLEHAQATARVIEVGKRGGCRSTPQALIERLMTREARAGLVVARVKGGDPCMFGRGGEELETLTRAGIEVEIINGITAGIAAPTAFGIPVTHREAGPGVIFVTGHTRDGDEPDWRALAATKLSLVIYMGAARARTIATKLVAGGLAASTPVAVIARASGADECAEMMSLGELESRGLSPSIASPAIIVIGEVVRRQVLPAGSTQNHRPVGQLVLVSRGSRKMARD